jgi:hypothetical protein
MYKNDKRQALCNDLDTLNTLKGYALKPTIEHKTFEDLSNGSKKVVYTKDVDFERIKKTVDALVQRPSVSEYKAIAVKDIEEIRQAQNALLKQQRKQAHEAYEKKLTEQKRLEQEEKNRLLSFKQMIATKLNCALIELPSYTTSMNLVTDRKTILKYLGPIEMPKEETIFRVTYRDNISKKASYAEAYDVQHNLLSRIDLN